jgi:hypothetical protein
LSKIEVDAVEPQSGTSLTLGASGDTITIPSGATFSATLTAPVIDEINDNNGNEEIIFTTTASAVNELTIANAATGNAPEIAATGDDTDIDLKLTPKGAGNLVLDGIEFPNADGSANQVLQTNGSGVLSFATPVAGITEADMFRLTASHTGDGDITSNLERVDSSGFSKIGTGMSQSSGIFTFPSTGIYQILVQANISYNNQSDNSATVSTSITLNNSSYTNVAYALSGNGNQTGATGVTCYSQYFLDVTDISNVKVKFTTGSFQGTLEGDTDINRTCFSFIRLGDT